MGVGRDFHDISFVRMLKDIASGQSDGGEFLSFLERCSQSELSKIFLNYRDLFGNTFLHSIAEFRKPEFISRVLEIIASTSNRKIVDAKNKSGETPLFRAIATDNPGIVSLFLNCGVKKDVRGTHSLCDVTAKKRYGINPLHHAIMMKCPKSALLLVKEGVRFGLDLNEPIVSKIGVPGDEMKTALHLCAQSGPDFLPVVEALLDANVNMFATAPNGLTPFTMAISSRNFECVRMMLDRGAGSEVPGKKGGIPTIHFAAKSSYEILDAVLEAGFDPNVRYTGWFEGNFEHEQTPIFYPVSRGDVKCTERILDAGADIEKQNGAGYTPLVQACLLGHGNVVGFLLGRGASVMNGERNTIISTMFFDRSISAIGTSKLVKSLPTLREYIFDRAISDPHFAEIVLREIKETLSETTFEPSKGSKEVTDIFKGMAKTLRSIDYTDRAGAPEQNRRSKISASKDADEQTYDMEL